MIVPWSDDDQPRASYGLRERVRAHIASRAPASAWGRVTVIPARYHEVGVDSVVGPTSMDLAGPVRDGAAEALLRFFHPLTGGPEGKGWPFGRDVHVSDVASALATVAGLGHVERLNLLRIGSPVPSPIAVPRDRIVAAGSIRVRLATGVGVGV